MGDGNYIRTRTFRRLRLCFIRRSKHSLFDMVKIIALLRRRAGLSFEDFITHYETRHAPLALSHMTSAVRYCRKYLRPLTKPAEDANGTHGVEPHFDAITELWVEDYAAAERTFAELAQPLVAAEIATDEEHFLDRGKIRLFFVVEERESDCSQLSRDVVVGALQNSRDPTGTI
jgi:EthD domain